MNSGYLLNARIKSQIKKHWEGVSKMIKIPSDLEGCSAPEGDTWKKGTPGCKVCAETVRHMQVKGLVAQSCLTLCDPMDCSPPGSSVHGVSR